jgi:hypothetical protein
MLITNWNISLTLFLIFIYIANPQRPIPYPISGYGSCNLVFIKDQVTLYAGDGNINSASGLLYYSFPAVHMESVQQTGLALCGFNIQN